VYHGTVFTGTPYPEWEDGKFKGFYLFLPSPSWQHHGLVRTYETSLYSKAQREAELLRRAIVDIRLPSEAPLIGRKKPIIGGGRYFDALLLGMIRYAPALPELVEVACHDLDSKMRHAAVGSIGDMGIHAMASAPQVARVVHNDASFWVREEAAETLGKIGNPAVVPDIREDLEEARGLAAAYHKLGYFYQKDGAKHALCRDNAFLFQNLLASLLKLDRNAGIEELRKSFEQGSILVNHHAKTAAMLCEVGNLVIPTDTMLTDGKFIDYSS
jgi:hypothetical protein